MGDAIVVSDEVIVVFIMFNIAYLLQVTIVMIFVNIQIVGKHANGEKINVMKSACIVEHLRYSYCNFHDVK